MIKTINEWYPILEKMRLDSAYLKADPLFDKVKEKEWCGMTRQTYR